MYLGTVQTHIMQEAITEEMLTKATLAVYHGLLPQQMTTEIEWTIDNTGQASVLEYWPACPRVERERVKVEIPIGLWAQFVFKVTASYL